jgi:hypothetical protein
MFRKSLFLAAALLAAAPAAFAQDGVSYPRTVGTGESAAINYGPGPHGNVVGGGALLTQGAGESFAVTYLNDANAQQPLAGLVPVSVTSGETYTVWAPAGTERTTLAMR